LQTSDMFTGQVAYRSETKLEDCVQNKYSLLHINYNFLNIVNEDITKCPEHVHAEDIVNIITVVHCSM